MASRTRWEGGEEVNTIPTPRTDAVAYKPDECSVEMMLVEQAILCRQLERELIAAAQWQPIETAPRDGTRVLVWCGDAAYICFWFQPPPETELKIGWTFKVGSLFCYMQQESVSHWMPLPPPPSEMFAPDSA